jgi:glycine/D-amino acid oxidase-like deaminating enzyme
MRVDFLIVGQGICGTMLSWYLHKEGKSFVVIDQGVNNNASNVAAGIINPVTGRRYVSAWMIDVLISFAQNSYEEIGVYLNSHFIFQKDIIDFFPSAQMRDAFVNRIAGVNTFLHTFPDQNHFNQHFSYDFGCGKIAPAYLVNMQILLASWRKKLFELQAFNEENFDPGLVEIKKNEIIYQEIKAGKIILCDGIASTKNPWFQLLPFSAVKGEALIIECKELPKQHIFKQGLMIAPLPVQHTFWVGSNYQWDFADARPSETFLNQTKEQLKRWLKVPFTILMHKAAIRPATIERRPFVGMHPHIPQIGILNGMGTKGTALAPFFAHQLVQYLVHDFPIMEEANVHRFSRILSK